MTMTSAKEKIRNPKRLSIRLPKRPSPLSSAKIEECIGPGKLFCEKLNFKYLDESQKQDECDQASRLMSRYVPTNLLRAEKGKDWTKEIRICTYDRISHSEKLRYDLHDFAQRIYEQELQNYCRSNVDRAFCMVENKDSCTLRQTKALSRCYVYAINGSSFHTLPYLLDLIEFISVDSPHTFEHLLWTIRDVFKHDYLPESFVAKDFREHDFTTQMSLWEFDLYAGETELMMYFFEEKVKEAYEKFILAICEFIGHKSAVHQEMALNFLVELLLDHPEQSVETIIFGIFSNLDGNPDCIDMALEEIISLSPTAGAEIVNVASVMLFKKGLTVDHRIRMAKALNNVELPQNVTYALTIQYCYLRSYLPFTTGDIDSDELFDLILQGLSKVVKRCRGYPESFLTQALLCSFDLSLGFKKHTDDRTIQLLALLIPLGSNLVTRCYRQLYTALESRKFEDYDAETTFLEALHSCAIEDECWRRGRVINKRLLQVGLNLDMRFTMRFLLLFSQNLSRSKKFSNLLKMLDYNGEAPQLKPGVNFRQPKDKEFHKFKMTSYYELLLYKNHYNPRISDAATKILRGKAIKYKGDIDIDFSLLYMISGFLQLNDDEFEKEIDDELEVSGQRYPPCAKEAAVIQKETNKILSHMSLEINSDYFTNSVYDKNLEFEEDDRLELKFVKKKPKSRKRDLATQENSTEENNSTIEPPDLNESFWSFESFNLDDDDYQALGEEEVDEEKEDSGEENMDEYENDERPNEDPAIAENLTPRQQRN